MQITKADAVKCGMCGKLHEYDAQTYYSIWGDVMRGHSGGLIGSNLIGDVVTAVSILCLGCFLKAIEHTCSTQRG